MTKAFISGILGQDGAYLAEFLLKKGYQVYGGSRRSSQDGHYRLKVLGIENEVNLVPFAGNRVVFGFNDLVNGTLD